MQTQTAQQTNGTTNETQAASSPSGQKHPGTTFDLVRKVGEVEGKAQWEKHGSLFMRANGSGGVAYLKQGGKVTEIAIFPRRPRT